MVLPVVAVKVEAPNSFVVVIETILYFERLLVGKVVAWKVNVHNWLILLQKLTYLVGATGLAFPDVVPRKIKHLSKITLLLSFYSLSACWIFCWRLHFLFCSTQCTARSTELQNGSTVRYDLKSLFYSNYSISQVVFC